MRHPFTAQSAMFRETVSGMPRLPRHGESPRMRLADHRHRWEAFLTLTITSKLPTYEFLSDAGVISVR